ncbi:hypothetical protein [Desulfofundulus sp. TPOSR]|uniref:hypothetical protein n=1 Tax=Desulfofundulus sp. TPOSR TaxID=2714340 RepID=UPI001FACAE04|nr:hypothetical protein [Desulfofundulus sp. TPOSR]
MSVFLPVQGKRRPLAFPQGQLTHESTFWYRVFGIAVQSADFNHVAGAVTGQFSQR